MNRNEAMKVASRRIRETFGEEYIKQHENDSTISFTEEPNENISIFVGFKTGGTTEDSGWSEFAEITIDTNNGDILFFRYKKPEFSTRKNRNRLPRHWKK